MSASEPPTQAALLQEVADLKRKLRLIKRKILDPTAPNLKQALCMIDDAFSADEAEKMSLKLLYCSTSTSSLRLSPTVESSVLCGGQSVVEKKPIITAHAEVQVSTGMIDAQTQSLELPKTVSIAVQTTVTGDAASRDTALFESTQSSIQKAIDILTNTKSDLNDNTTRKKRMTIDRPASSRPLSKEPSVRASSSSSQTSSASSVSVCTTPGRPLVNMQRVRSLTDHKKMAFLKSPMMPILAIEGGSSGSRAARRGTPSLDSPVPEKKSKKMDWNDEHSLHGYLSMDHNPESLSCCGKKYQRPGCYFRHRREKHNDRRRTD